MDWAVAWVGVASEAADAHVADLRMHFAMDELAVDDGSAADAGADGDVDKVVGLLRGTPELLSDGGRVNVGIENGGAAERGFKSLPDWEIAPGKFGRQCTDAAFGNVQGAEAGDACPLQLSTGEKSGDEGQCLARR